MLPMRVLWVPALCLILSACGAAALPCKLARDVVDVVPVVGDAASTPFDACAKAID